jgi:hypothetical protein
MWYADRHYLRVVKHSSNVCGTRSMSVNIGLMFTNIGLMFANTGSMAANKAFVSTNIDRMSLNISPVLDGTGLMLTSIEHLTPVFIDFRPSS